MQFAEAFPDAEEEFGVAGRDADGGGDATAELQEDLVGDRLVALRAEGMAGMGYRAVADRMEAERLDDIAQHIPARLGRHAEHGGPVGEQE